MYCILVNECNLNYERVMYSIHLSRSVRPCEPTICYVVTICKLNLYRMYIHSTMIGWVLRVCDSLSCVLRRVTVELLIYMLCFVSIDLIIRFKA